MSSTVSEVKRGCKESHIWNHYIKEPLGSGHYTAKCHYCTQTWSRRRPEILKSHLALYCKEVPLAIKSEYMEMLAIGSTSTNRKQKLDTDSSAEIDADKKDRINQALIESHSQLNCFIIITPGKRQYIHTLKDISVDSHTGSFNATEIENILTTIGPKKFAAVVFIFY
uniref:BED-type domain-containing protein n=1 Tax=Rhizophagus irregularis (strain DAOM 181602 / DAOM 197198 / MUCL 43194) TaxID=747089 RepID=U9T9I8_RHIID